MHPARESESGALPQSIQDRTDEITRQFQQHNRCANLRPYDRKTVIDEVEYEGEGLGHEISLIEKYDRTMTEPHASVRVIVSFVWPVEGGEGELLDMPTNFVASFQALAGMYDGGRSIDAATQRARRWCESTIKAQLSARDEHRLTMGIEA